MCGLGNQISQEVSQSQYDKGVIFLASAIFMTILAWFVGLFLDANIGANPFGMLELRILFPMITMGCFILKALDKKDS